MFVNIAKQWVRDLSGKKFTNKKIIKELLPHKNNAGMQGFVMNLRRELFSDRRVRQALGMAFDFQWTNKSLFFEQYTQNNSYFSNSPLAAVNLPEGLELEYLQPFKDQLPQEVFTTPLSVVSTNPPASLRKNLRHAKKLLSEAGWSVKNGKLVKNGDEQQTFDFEILLVSPSFERVMAPYVNNLKKLGINASYRTIDPTLYTRRVQTFDYDMIVTTFGQSQSPGNEQRDYWHSAMADQEGSKNLIGLKDPVVDKLVDKIIYANNQKELTAACKALDRVLWYGYYIVPNWYVAKHRVAYWDMFEQPSELPLYYSPSQTLLTWWDK
jgi:microcin C transport system substrate-binding protein